MPNFLNINFKDFSKKNEAWKIPSFLLKELEQDSRLHGKVTCNYIYLLLK